MRKIKSIDVLISGQEGGIITYRVGQVVNGIEIAEIKDGGQEFEDSVHCAYYLKCNKNKIVSAIENCPVIVEYMEVVENK